MKLSNYAIKPLTREVEKELLIQARKGNLRARELLVKSLILYGVRLANRYSHEGMTLDDYVQHAMIGILNAIDSMDLNLDYRLSTHTTWCIRKEITKAQSKADLIRTTARKSPKTIGTLVYDVPHPNKISIVEPDSLWFMPLLNKRERQIIQWHYYDDIMQVDIAKELKLSKERIRQILVEIFEKVRYAEGSRDEQERNRRFYETKKIRHNNISNNQ